MALDFLFNGAPPQNVTGATSSITGMPDWYQEYLRGIAGKATEVAGQGYTQYPGARLADFTPDQLAAFDNTRAMSGAWQPFMQNAVGAAGQSLPTSSAFLDAGAQYGSGALGAASSAAGQAQNWAANPNASNYALSSAGAIRDAASDPRSYQAALGAAGNAQQLAGDPTAANYAQQRAAQAMDYGSSPLAAMYAQGAGAQANQRAGDTSAVRTAQGAAAGAQGYASSPAAALAAAGAGQSAMNYAGSTAAPGYALGAGQQALNSVGGQAANWTDNWQQYMSPYTSSVVDEIARLGNRNLQENLIANTNDAFIGSGGYGSTRNADIIGRNIRDAQRDISGQQSAALQQGYGQAANIFAQDASRGQTQQQLQANTALQAGQLGTGALNQYAQLGSNTALQAGTLNTNALQNMAQLGANTALQGGQLASGAQQAQSTLGANTALQAGQLGTGALQNMAQLGSSTALQGGQLGANALQNQQQLGVNAALQGGQLASGALGQYAQLGVNAANSAGQLGSNSLFNQQQLGANTALQGGQLAANTGLQAGSLANSGAQIGAASADQSAARFGALGQLQQQLGYQDAGALGAVGTAQQGLQQQGLDLGYQNFLEQRGWNWDTLNNLNSVLRGMQLPTSQTSVTNQPYGNVGTSPAQWATMLYGLGNTNAPKTTTGG